MRYAEKRGKAHRAQGAGQGAEKSRRDGSMVDKTVNPLLFRANEGAHYGGIETPRGVVGCHKKNGTAEAIPFNIIKE